MKLYPDSKVYILCPANVGTGGTESLHQLASQLTAFGVETYMLYAVRFGETLDAEKLVNDALKKYHVPYSFELDESPRNVVIAPETMNNIGLYAVQKCRRVLWWMSVDNYFENVIKIFRQHLREPLAAPVPKIFLFDNAVDAEHWGQSEYVRQFLRLNGVKKIRAVETHMSQIFLGRAAQTDFDAKKNIVAYNPRKGLEVTERLIDSAPDIDWRPIEGMTPAQVQELLAAAKVYIDFGNFPGRERLPREAALSGCVVITGRRGAASNDVDINIPAEFKFDERTANPQDVIDKIREVFDDFGRAFDKQRAFRERELHAQENFASTVAEAFEIKKFPPPSVAFVQGVGEKSFLLAQTLLRSRDFKPAFIVDDVLAATKISDALILREQNRNYLRVGENVIEIISRDDAQFLYLEGRIKNFALLEPYDAELATLNEFYAPRDEDILIFER